MTELSLAAFARAAAAQGPVPGSGSVAAGVGALGAGLVSKALGSVRGEPKAARLAAEAERAMSALLECVERDARAYSGYLEARAGRGELATAVAASIAVPREIADHALAALEHLVAGFESVRTRLHSEGVTASHTLRAAIEGAVFTARSNLPGLADPTERERLAAEFETLVSRARLLVHRLDALACVQPLHPR